MSGAVKKSPEVRHEPVYFGRFELVRRVSSGGMGDIYLAKTRGPYAFEKRFILKLIKNERLNDPIHLKFFAREARIGANLDHPNVVPIYDFGSVRGKYFISMEYVDGISLSRLNKYLRTNGLKMPIELAAYIARESAEALHYLHFGRKLDGSIFPVIHRDVSPENILISRPRRLSRWR